MAVIESMVKSGFGGARLTLPFSIMTGTQQKGVCVGGGGGAISSAGIEISLTPSALSVNEEHL